MPTQPPPKPTGPRLPAAKDAGKLMQEGVLALERGRLKRAEQRFMATLMQLRQLDPISWNMHQILGLLRDLRLAQDDLEAAAQMERKQRLLARKLKDRPIP